MPKTPTVPRRAEKDAAAAGKPALKQPSLSPLGDGDFLTVADAGNANGNNNIGSSSSNHNIGSSSSRRHSMVTLANVATQVRREGKNI